MVNFNITGVTVSQFTTIFSENDFIVKVDERDASQLKIWATSCGGQLFNTMRGSEGIAEKLDSSNLKLVLMQLGNRLVTEKGYQPSNQMAAQRIFVGAASYSTTMIAAFTEWLNRSDEAQQILKDMGFDWPTAPRPNVHPE